MKLGWLCCLLCVTTPLIAIPAEPSSSPAAPSSPASTSSSSASTPSSPESSPSSAASAPGSQASAPSSQGSASPFLGYSAQGAVVQAQWEKKFRDGVLPDNIRENMRRLSARPHHVGSTYDKDNAEWILSKFKAWGFDAKIETFNVLFPTPKERILEMLEPTPFRASLQESIVPSDPTSGQTNEQLPTYNAYSADGDVTARLVYVNYGDREDYEQLDRLGISVKGAIVVARYGRSWSQAHRGRSRIHGSKEMA